MAPLRGRLSTLLRMPLDAVADICTHLEPLDLLHLARASKGLRAMFMSRRSQHIWRAARTNIDGLPDCPSHLSEAAYANLVFSSHCHNCMKEDAHYRVLWEFNTRYCMRCKIELVSTNFRLPKNMRDRFTSGTGIWHVLNYIQTSNSQHIPDSPRGGRCLHVPQKEALLQAWADLEPDDAEGREGLLTRQRELVNQIQTHAAACRIWEKRRASEQAVEREYNRSARTLEILTRLIHMGYQPEVQYLMSSGPALSNLPHTRTLEPLTEQEWSKIRGSLVQHMEELREMATLIANDKKVRDRRRIVEGIVGAYYAEASRTAAIESKPRLVDINMIPDIRDLVEDVDRDIDMFALPYVVRRLVRAWEDEALQASPHGAGLPDSA